MNMKSYVPVVKKGFTGAAWVAGGLALQRVTAVIARRIPGVGKFAAESEGKGIIVAGSAGVVGAVIASVLMGKSKKGKAMAGFAVPLLIAGAAIGAVAPPLQRQLDKLEAYSAKLLGGTAPPPQLDGQRAQGIARTISSRRPAGIAGVIPIR